MVGKPGSSNLGASNQSGGLVGSSYFEVDPSIISSSSFASDFFGLSYGLPDFPQGPASVVVKDEVASNNRRSIDRMETIVIVFFVTW